MSKPAKETKRGWKRKAAFGMFFAFAVAAGIYSMSTSIYTAVDDPTLTECPLELGMLSCLDAPVVPFFNPGKEDLSGIEVTVPKANGIDIYKVSQPLKANETQTLVLHALACPSNVTAGIRVRWCCHGKCYETPLPEEAGDFRVEEKPEQKPKAYSEHPEPAECASLDSPTREFCLDDAAEVKGDISICGQIADLDIKRHCMGRIALDESICREIAEAGLREGCMESIAMKRSWSQG